MSDSPQVAKPRPTPIDVGLVFSDGWRIFRQNPLGFMLYGILALGAASLFTLLLAYLAILFLGEMVFPGSYSSDIGSRILVGIAVGIGVIWLWYAASFSLLNNLFWVAYLIDAEEPISPASFTRPFEKYSSNLMVELDKGFRFILPYIGASLASLLLYFVMSSGGVSRDTIAIYGILSLIINIGTGIWIFVLFCRYTLSAPFVFFQGASPGMATKKSRTMYAQHPWVLVGINLVFGFFLVILGVAAGELFRNPIPGILFLLIGGSFVCSYYLCINFVLYRELEGQEIEDESEATVEEGEI